jgi:hypothetical protein
MAKFGLFTGYAETPDQVFEGDDMYMDGAFVKIVKSNRNDGEKLVGAIHLDKNQSVKMLP